MMIPYGYKRTEVGVIPEDWECVKIKDVATISMCKRIFANQTSTIGDVPFYKIGTFGKEADAYISSKLYVEYRNKYSFPQKGDILISAAGTLGRTVVYDGEKAYFQDSNIVWLDINKTRLCNEYLNQYYKVIKWASSEGSTIARLYNGIIYATYISLPPLQEQQRIAEALSDVDGMISSLEKLIAKYKSIKTACLQRMFPQNGETVPRMRLPGFTGAWEQRKLGELGTITTGNTPSTSIPDYYSDDGIVWVTPTDICENITFESARKLSDLGQQVGRVVPKNTILVTCIASIGKNTMLGNTGSFNQQINGLTPNENKYDPYFLLTESALWSAKMKGSAAAGTMQIVNRTEFSELKTWLPSLIEQQAIGAFFKQLDHLITLHQRKLEKVQKIKQGMMQQLLTGKIRLV